MMKRNVLYVFKVLCLKVQFLRILSYSKHDGTNLNKTELYIKLYPTSKKTENVSGMQTNKPGTIIIVYVKYGLYRVWCVGRVAQSV
jgi:hypothetical protein